MKLYSWQLKKETALVGRFLFNACEVQTLEIVDENE